MANQEVVSPQKPKGPILPHYLRQIKKTAALKLRESNSRLTLRTFCWLLDQTKFLTRSVALHIPETYCAKDQDWFDVTIGFHELRTSQVLPPFQPLMERLGNGFLPLSCDGRFIKAVFDDTVGGVTVRISAMEVCPEEDEVPFDAEAILRHPMPGLIARPLTKDKAERLAHTIVIAGDVANTTRKLLVYLLDQTRGVWATSLFFPSSESLFSNSIPDEVVAFNEKKGLESLLERELETTMRLSCRAGHYDAGGKWHDGGGWTFWLSDTTWDKDAVQIPFNAHEIEKVNLEGVRTAHW